MLKSETYQPFTLSVKEVILTMTQNPETIKMIDKLYCIKTISWQKHHNSQKTVDKM